MLFGLIAISVPIAIHLWSRQKPKLIKIGTLKYIENSDIKKARNLKLTQIPLLILRMLILILLVSILSELAIQSNPGTVRSALIFEEDMMEDKRIREQITKIESAVTETFTFKEAGANNQDFYRIIKSLDLQGFDSIYVFTHGYYKNYKGRKPAVSSNIQWNLIPDTNKSIDETPVVYKLDNTSYLNIHSHSTHTSITYDREYSNVSNSSDSTIVDLSTINIGIYQNQDLFDNNSRLLVESGIKAVQKWLKIEIKVEYLEKPTTDKPYSFIVYIDDPELLKNTELNKERIVVFSEGSISQPTRKYIAKNNLIYSIPLALIESPEVYAGYGLSDRLLKIITEADCDVVDIRAIDRIEDIELYKIDSEKDLSVSGFHTFPTVLLILLTISVVIERLYSNFYLKTKNGAKG